jgi:outer membrane protein OmpA-like peptidoglycan-associated protein/Mg-chelatase subunit ChlD
MKITPLVITLLGVLWGFPIFAQSNNEPQLRIRLHPAQIYAPQQVNLSWEGSNVRRVEIVGLVDELPPSGEYLLNFEPDTQYKLIAYGKKPKQMRTYNVRIPFKTLKINHFIAKDTLLASDLKTLVSWQVQDAVKLRLEANGQLLADDLPLSGSKEIRMGKEHIYLQLIAEVPDQQLIITKALSIYHRLGGKFEGGSVLPNEAGLLRWDIPQADSVRLEETYPKPQILGEALPAVGSLTVGTLDAYPNGRTFVLTAFKEGLAIGEQTARLWSRVTRLRLVAKLAQEEKGTTHLTLGQGEMFRLVWNATNLDSLRLYEENKLIGQFKGNGSRTLTAPLTSRTYQMRAYDPEQRHWEETSVQVTVRNRHFVKNNIALQELAKDHPIMMEIIATDYSQYPDRITLRVLAVDTVGNFVSGLANSPDLVKKYFVSLTENFDKQVAKVGNFQVKEVSREVSAPYHFSLALDYSGSMIGAPIASLEAGLKEFIRQKSPKDRISLTKFDHNLHTVVRAQTNPDSILAQYPMGLSKFGGATALYAAADLALEVFEPQQYNQVLVLMTDGMDNASLLHENKAFSAMELVRKARAQGVGIYPVVYGQGVNEEVMQQVAELTGGYIYFTNQAKDLIDIYQEIPRLFQHYYEISYKPTPRDGGRFIQLTYFNQQSEHQAGRGMFVGEGYDLSKLDLGDVPSLKAGFEPIFKGKHIIAAPQVVALFGFNQANLEEAYKTNLQPIISFLNKRPKAVIEVYGHTDMVGDTQRQVVLSEQRAEVVKQYLISQGIAPERIATKGFGKAAPVWPEEKAPWQAQENRRIEVLLLE